MKILERILPHSQEHPQQYLFLSKYVCIYYILYFIFFVPGNY